MQRAWLFEILQSSKNLGEILLKNESEHGANTSVLNLPPTLQVLVLCYPLSDKNFNLLTKPQLPNLKIECWWKTEDAFVVQDLRTREKTANKFVCEYHAI